MSDETTREPRRQAVPPDKNRRPDSPGIWVRTRVWVDHKPEVRAFHFYVSEGPLDSGDLVCSLPGITHGPSTLTGITDSWEGPFPVPSLAALSERDRLREAAKWFLRQLDDIAFYSGTPDGTYRRLSHEMERKVMAALSAEAPRP